MPILPIGIWTRINLAMQHVRREAGHSPEQGFTLLEMLLVLFLLAGVLGIVLPRFVTGEDLSSAGRKFIGALRTLQGLAAAGQKTVRLHVDLDRGTYWAMVLEGKEEKRPLDAAWAAPRSLPDAIRFTEVSVGQTKRVSGLATMSLFPNGRVDPVMVLFADASNNVLALAVDSFTGAIRISDERFEPLRNQPVPERIKPLLQSTVQANASPTEGLKF